MKFHLHIIQPEPIGMDDSPSEPSLDELAALAEQARKRILSHQRARREFNRSIRTWKPTLTSGDLVALRQDFYARGGQPTRVPSAAAEGAGDSGWKFYPSKIVKKFHQQKRHARKGLLWPDGSQETS